MTTDPNDYPRRKLDFASRERRVARLIDGLRKLEQQTDPKDGAKSAEGKDRAAWTALVYAAHIVEALAGWALDHQAGLAVENLQAEPAMADGIEEARSNYLANLSMIDDHRHERVGGKLVAASLDFLDPIVARRWLKQLLMTNPGGFPRALHLMTVEALEALDYGEVQPIIAPTKHGRKRNLTELRLQLRAIGLVEYRRMQGGQKARAQRQVADAFGVSVDTLKSWELRLKNEFGQIKVLTELSRARNGATYEEEAKRRASFGDLGNVEAEFPVGYFESQYGAEALQKLAQEYKETQRTK